MKPVLFTVTLGGREVGLHTYGLLIAVGFAAGIALAWREARRRPTHYAVDAGRLLDLAFWMLVWALVGSRLLYVLSNAREFAAACGGTGDPRTLGRVLVDCTRILHIWEGGLVFYGGFAAAAATAAYFARREGWSFRRLGDLLAPSIAIGQAFGRLGCLAAGCCFGKPCAGDRPWCLLFPHGSVAFDELHATGAIGANTTVTPALHGTQLYEATGGLLLFAALLLLRRRAPRAGVVLWTYLIGYGSLRFVVELFRGDVARGYMAEVTLPRVAAALGLPASQPLLLTAAQAISVAVASVGVIMLIRDRRSGRSAAQ